jgi:probable rRNA maturation factor
LDPTDHATPSATAPEDAAAQQVVLHLAELPRYVVDEAKLTQLALTVLDALGVADHELSLSLVDSDAIQDMNREFRGKDRPTDVLSFPQQDFSPPLSALTPRAKARARAKRRGPPPVLGDVVISLPEAEANAGSIGQALDREVAFLLVHGMLHLAGHDHEVPDDEQLMLAEQRALMDRFAGGEGAPPAWTGCVVLASPQGGL